LYTPINIRVLATYPAEADWPEETFDLTYQLRSDFASTPGGAHMRIVAAMELGAEAIAFPVADDDYVVEFSTEVVKEIRVW
jgi:hypothetical protein